MTRVLLIVLWVLALPPTLSFDDELPWPPTQPDTEPCWPIQPSCWYEKRR